MSMLDSLKEAITQRPVHLKNHTSIKLTAMQSIS